MSDKPRLKITDVKSIPFREFRTIGVMEPAWDPGRSRPQHFGASSFVEVHTDQGLTGIGPAVDARLIPDIKERLLGEDPFDVERHAHILRYYAFGAPYQGTAGVRLMEEGWKAIKIRIHHATMAEDIRTVERREPGRDSAPAPGGLVASLAIPRDTARSPDRRL